MCHWSFVKRIDVNKVSNVCQINSNSMQRERNVRDIRDQAFSYQKKSNQCADSTQATSLELISSVSTLLLKNKI